MRTELDFRPLIAGATGRHGLAPLLAALGFDPSLEVVPEGGWSAYGLAAHPEVGDVLIAGRAGSLDALLIETRAGSESTAPQIARRVRARNPARLHLFVIADARYRQITLGVFGLDDTFHNLTIERDRVRRSDLEALVEMVPGSGETGLQLAMRHARALDRTGITRRFFRDFRARRAAIADAWTGLPVTAAQDRAQLALLFLSRLTFLYFLQGRGALAGNDRYLVDLYAQWMGGSESAEDRHPSHSRPSFFSARLRPLFFGALNRRPEARSASARALGPLPYLNGGLFEMHATERRAPDLDLGDTEVGACFDHLLERYRFSGRESGDGGGHGVDPEILGRVFEGLMDAGERSGTGSFYTPAPVVARVVREAVATYLTVSCTRSEARAIVDGGGAALPESTRYRARTALQRVRVLDPACGSGAFLLGALQRLTVCLAPLTGQPVGEVRREVVARSLHGVDLLDDAALLCSLRLWLALATDDDEVRPLPNLDRRIRQGDALVDPLDLGSLEADGDGEIPWHPLRDAGLRRALHAVAPAARSYLESSPEERTELRQDLERAESRLARRWVEGARQAYRRRLRGLGARAADRDLFGELTESARRAGAAAEGLEGRVRDLDRLATAMAEKGSLPFFSFGVHFADAAPGFDLIVSNPPWVRSHRWPDRLRRLARRYEVCRDAAWKGTAARGAGGAGAGAQVDLSLLFVERAVRLLAPGGVLAVLLPAKALRALYGGGARRMLLRDLEFALIEDHALDHRSVFQADAFTAVLIGRKRRRIATGSPAVSAGDHALGNSPGDSDLRVRMVRRGVEPLEYTVGQRDLPLFPDDPSSPWVMAPPPVVTVFRRMQEAGPPLGAHEGLRVRRGVMTGANGPLLFPDVEPKLGGLAAVTAEGHRRARREGRSGTVASHYRGVVEMEALRPLVRGAGIDAFHYRSDGYVAWCHDETAAPVHPPRRMRQYLERHRNRLEGRAGWRKGMPLGSVFRLSPETLGPKVAWHDLSDTLRAVALPARVRRDGHERELVPLNTVYFLPTPDQDTSMLLAGILNSLPVRTMARAVAERAKDARFRFFAWAVSALPLPNEWRSAPASREVLEISASAHRNEGTDTAQDRRLDRAVAHLYGLDVADIDTLSRFDAWLRAAP